MTPGNRERLALGVIFVAFAFVSGWRLGHYALWDDEANTALFAEGVAHTGDTTAVLGDNLVAFRGGSELEGEKARYVSPLQYYVAAPFIAAFGNTSFAARFPFWLFGLASLGLVLRRLWRREATLLLLVSWGLGFVLCTSLVLYVRQCRYYSLALFFSIWTVDLYLFAKPGRRRALLIGLASSLTFVSNYLNGVALAGAIVLDALLFGERPRKEKLRQRLLAMAPAALPHLAISLPVFLVWNPLGKSVVQDSNGLRQKLLLVFWNFRDANSAEFFPVLVLAAALFLGWRRKDAALRRSTLALFTYFTLIAFLSPQPLSYTRVADIRYLVPAIPLSIFICIRTFASARRWPWLTPAGVALSYGTSLLNGGFLPGTGFHSTPLKWTGELADPYTDAYRASSEWLKSSAQAGETVLVLPSYMQYPLMYHAPAVRYAWQLPAQARASYPGLPEWQFEGRAAPDWIVVFAGQERPLASVLQLLVRAGARYRRAATLPVYGKDEFRPELFWRSFSEVKSIAPERDGIRIFRRM